MTLGPPVFVVCGGPGSGKDALIQAVKDMGAFHASIVPKHTSRERREEDGEEMICPGDELWNLSSCDLIYENHGDKYGIELRGMWEKVRQRIPQVLVVSNPNAINQLCNAFGHLIVLIYVHSDIDVSSFVAGASQSGSEQDSYIANRAAEFGKAFELYVVNMMSFRHVVIYSGAQEDMFDQLFRIFRYYETK